jgi:3-oxoacyl-[acyl-carrier protein] reductase
MDTGLSGKVVVVTGASGGIGSAIARHFAAEGARVVLHYHSARKSAVDLQRELESVESIIVQGDLTREVDAQRLFAQARKRFGRVDTLIANAGAWETRDVPLHKMSLRQWRSTLDGILTSTFLTVREFFKLASAQRRGNAVMIASTAGVFGEAGHCDYAAGKSAIAYGMTRSLKNELSRIAPHTREYCGGRINSFARVGQWYRDWRRKSPTSTWYEK